MSPHALALVILLCNPGMGRSTADGYGRLLTAEASRHGFDALDAAALICHESRWRAGAVSPDGEDFGLGQIRARYVGACVLDSDPVGHPSPGCVAVKATLLDGSSNIRRMADLIMRWTKVCRRKAGSGRARQWLAGYGGMSRPSESRWCGRRRQATRWVEETEPKVQEILTLRRRLARGLPPLPPRTSR
jgi:hypothetical protein